MRSKPRVGRGERSGTLGGLRGLEKVVRVIGKKLTAYVLSMSLETCTHISTSLS